VTDPDQEAVVSELRGLYEESRAGQGWERLAGCEKLRARVVAHLPGYNFPSEPAQIALVLKTLIDEAVSHDVMLHEAGLVTPTRLRNCRMAVPLIGAVKNPGENYVARQRQAATAAFTSLSTVRRYGHDSDTCYRDLVSAIDSVIKNAKPRELFARRSGLTKPAESHASAAPPTAEPIVEYESKQSIADVLTISASLRRSLDPQKVAQALVRSSIIGRVLEAVDVRGTPASNTRVLTLRGDAGIGKTVVAGQIYDALIDSSSAAVLVVPCEMVLSAPSDVDELDSEFGQIVGRRAGIVSIVRTLAEELSNPIVVLFDTVDYLLTSARRASFIELFLRLREAGATVIFTCRDHDYNVVFGANKARLGRLTLYTADPVDLKSLDDSEVVEIAISYLDYRQIRPAMGAEQFARRVLDLAANNVSLRTIATNPLLLVMLCDTFAEGFAEKHHIPPDLTTTSLCREYCNQKTKHSRQRQGDAVFAARKLKLWYKISAEMWRRSDDHITLSVPEILLIEDEELVDAYQEFRSEGFLVPEVGEVRVRFHHQVIAEYSIAVYLRDVEPGELNRLLDELRREPAKKPYGWQIVRHLLADSQSADESTRLLDKLDLSQAPAFRSAAFGIAEAWHEGLLERLPRSKEYIDQLLEALLNIQADGIGEAITVLVDVMKTSQSQQITSAAGIVGLLAVRDSERLHDNLLSALEVIREFQDGEREAPGVKRGYMGWTLNSLLQPIIDRQVALDDSVLKALRRSILPGTSPIGVRAIIRAYLVDGVAKGHRRALLAYVLAHPRANETSEEGVELVTSTVKWRLNSSSQARDQIDAVEFLRAGEETSEVLRARAVARAMAEQPALRTVVLKSFIDSPDDKTTYRLLRCLREVTKAGGDGWLSAMLTSENLSDNSITVAQVSSLLKAFADSAGSIRYMLADWFEPHLTADNWKTIDGYASLVLDDRGRLSIMLNELVKVDAREQGRVISNVTDKIGQADLHEFERLVDEWQIESSEPDVGILRARMAGRAARRSEHARQKLIDLAGSPSSRVAKQALLHLKNAARSDEAWLSPSMLMPFSAHEGRLTRLGALEALVIKAKEHRKFDDLVIERWIEAANERNKLTRDSNQEHIELLKLCHAYVRDGRGRVTNTLRQILIYLRDVIDGITESSVPYARTLFGLLKTAVMHPDRDFSQKMSNYALVLLEKIDIAAVKDGPRWSREMLFTMVDQGYLQLDRLISSARSWYASSLIAAIDIVVGRDPARERSTLLDEVLAWEDADPAVHQAIWNYRLEAPK
jgi:hypothetical protein